MNKLISSKPINFNGIEIFTISFLLTLFITGIFAFVGFAYPTSRILPANYYKLKNPVKINRLYNVLGVKYFKVLLLLFFWGRKNNRKKYYDGTKKGLQNFIYQTKQSEFGHLSAFLSIFIASILLIIHGYFILTTIVTLMNILGNLYPIILQRHHRFRIEKITKYYKK